MRAATVRRYGPPDVVTIQDIPTPRPRSGEVLVQITAATVNSGDARIRGARFPKGLGVPGRLALGVRRPRQPVLGVCLSGVVTEVGPGVTLHAVGDEVCGMTGARMGAHAEYATAKAVKLVAKPATVSHEDAVGVLFGGSTARHFLRLGDVRVGSTVLVVGASGAVGTNAVQLAKLTGATVTAVTSAPNAERVRELGADHVIDYRRTDLAQLGERFDVVFDTVGALSPKSGRRLLTEHGTLLLAAASLWEMIAAGRRVKTGTAAEDPDDFRALLDLVAAGDLRVVVDDVLALTDIAAAHARVDSGRKVGNLVVRP